jgi:hypothetical protein
MKFTIAIEPGSKNPVVHSGQGAIELSGCSCCDRLVFVYNALLHDKVDPLEHADVDERIALYGDYVRGLSCSDRAERLRVTDEISGVDSGTLNGLHWRHTVLDHESELARVHPGWADGGVSPEGHFDPGTHCFGEIAALRFAEISFSARLALGS